MGADVPIPHHTSLVKLAGKLDVKFALAQIHGPVDVVAEPRSHF